MDRSAPPRWRGRPIDPRPGETLVATLARLGVPFLGRSIRYHRPRGTFCGTGACTQCLVRVNGVPGVRACRYVPVSGDEIRVENAWPSVGFDIAGAFDVAFPNGIDTLRGFRRPRFATPLYQAVVRRLAGVGTLPSPREPPPPVRGEAITTDVVVVGAGASGTAAAEKLVAAGRSSLVLDRDPSAKAPAGSTIRAGVTAVFLPPPSTTDGARFQLVAIAGPTTSLLVRAASVVVAVGGYDANLWFAGSDRPGVLTGDGALAVAPGTAAPPFRRALIVGGGARAESLVDRFSESIEAVVAPGAISPEVTAVANRHEIPLYPRTLLVAASGRRRVRSVDLRSRGDGRAFHLEVDAIVLAHRRVPNPQLFFQAGASMGWSGSTGAYYPSGASPAATSVPGLFAVGEAGGYLGADATASGTAAAEAILGTSVARPERSIDRLPPSELPGYYRELRAHLRGRGKVIVCACEDIVLSELEESTERGYRGIEVVKRQTGVGTGLCQGRYCLPDALLWLSMQEGRPPADVGYITQRPPVFPAPLGALASLPDEAPP